MKMKMKGKIKRTEMIKRRSEWGGGGDAKERRHRG
jgi:hypothetical protein